MLNYNFIQGNAIERIHLQLCINVLRVKRTTQHECVYGELGRVNYQCRRYFNIIKYWVKLLHTNDTKFYKKVYLMLKLDSDTYPSRKSWCTLIKQLLGNLGLAFSRSWTY